MSTVLVAPSAEELESALLVCRAALGAQLDPAGALELTVAEWPGVPPAEPAVSPAAWWSPGRALRRMGGLEESRLDACDRAFYTRLLGAVLGAGVLAAVSLSVALSMTTGASMVGWPLVAGVIFALLITNNDLSIVMPDPHRRGGFSAVVGRMAFAVVFGFLVSLPLTAAVFAADVDHAQAAARDQRARDAAVAFEARRPQLEAAVVEGHRPAVQAATAARDGAREDLDRARATHGGQMQACNAEVTGGPGGSGLVGEGPRSSVLCATVEQLAATEATARNRLDIAEGQLRVAVEDERRAIDAAVTAARPADEPPVVLGVVDRIEATHARLGAWSWLIAAALVLLDLSPVIGHLCSGPRPYERALDPAGAAGRAAEERDQLAGAGGDLAVDVELDEEAAAAAEKEADRRHRLEQLIASRSRRVPRPSNNQLYQEALAGKMWCQSLPSFNRYLRRRDEALRAAAGRLTLSRGHPPVL
jgi:hypothetical protein